MANHQYLRITFERPGTFFARLGSSWLRVNSDQGQLRFATSCNTSGPPTLSPNGAARLAQWMEAEAKG